MIRDHLTENHLNNESEMIDFLLVHKPGGEFGTSTMSLCVQSTTEWKRSLIVTTNLKFQSRNKRLSPLFSKSGGHVVVKGRMLESMCRIEAQTRQSVALLARDGY